MKSQCFAPIARADARTLILGSLPGQMSLLRGEYYAHPQNAFWKIMAKLFNFSLPLPYDDRKQRLLEESIALWDVCASAFRPGSLDAAIEDFEPNAFAEFFAAHPQIDLVCFNGATAEKIYRRNVLQMLPAADRIMCYQKLPSTSPAYSSITFDQKLSEWSVVRRSRTP